MAKKSIDNRQVMTVLVVVAAVIIAAIWSAINTNKTANKSYPSTQATTTSTTKIADKTEPPKPKEWGDGTYEVGRDIPTGTYIANGTDCYWAIYRDSNGSDIIANNAGNGQQIVKLDTPGTFFKVDGCPFTERK